MKNKKELREVERDLVDLCRKYDISLCSGYALGQPIMIDSGKELTSLVYEVSPRGVKYSLYDHEFQRRFRRKYNEKQKNKRD